MENKHYTPISDCKILTQSDIDAINKTNIGNMVSLQCGAIIKIIENPYSEDEHCNNCCFTDSFKCHKLNCTNHGKYKIRISYERIK